MRLAKVGTEWRYRSFLTRVDNDWSVRSSVISPLYRSTKILEAQMITDDSFYSVTRIPAGSRLYRLRLFAHI
jgi:hypothetical protein